MLQESSFSNALVFLSSIADKEFDTHKERMAHRFLIYLGTLMSIGGIIWGSISMYSGIFYESFIPFSYALITLMNFTYLYYTKDFQSAQFVQVLVSLLLPFVFQFFLGGFVASGAVVLWSILTILGSFSFQNKKTTLKWFIVYLLLIATCGAIDRQFNYITIEVPTEISLLFITLNITLISIIIFTLFYYFVSSEEKLQEQLSLMANTDHLTSLPNRRAFFEAAHKEFSRVKRGAKDFSILMFDIDYFKNINDTFGHEVGDRALKKFATLLFKESRDIDILGRYGGEEFIVLLPETDVDAAKAFAQRIIVSCRELSLSTHQGDCSFTVSIGVTRFNSIQNELIEPIARADLALYKAKDAGRDQLQVA